MSQDNKDNDFFIGWADTPQVDRRFFVRTGIGLMGASALGAAGVAALQNPPGAGGWDMANTREWTGIVTADPYPMLRTTDIDNTPRTALLACLGKCGVGARIAEVADGPATVRGSLIQRGRHAMIAVVDDMDWITPASGKIAPALEFPTPQFLTDIDLSGEILDSKCWFGAMRPSEGKVHKSCASLCIRGGIPPAFFAQDRQGAKMLMVMTSGGLAHDETLLPLVADPVRIQGRLLQMGDQLLLDAPVSDIARI